ncbi:hypothetical protein EDC01DRAFT_656732, partial [Geopyxis carbonaria]
YSQQFEPTQQVAHQRQQQYQQPLVSIPTHASPTTSVSRETVVYQGSSIKSGRDSSTTKRDAAVRPIPIPVHEHHEQKHTQSTGSISNKFSSVSSSSSSSSAAAHSASEFITPSTSNHNHISNTSRHQISHTTTSSTIHNHNHINGNGGVSLTQASIEAAAAVLALSNAKRDAEREAAEKKRRAEAERERAVNQESQRLRELEAQEERRREREHIQQQEARLEAERRRLREEELIRQQDREKEERTRIDIRRLQEAEARREREQAEERRREEARQVQLRERQERERQIEQERVRVAEAEQRAAEEKRRVLQLEARAAEAERRRVEEKRHEELRITRQREEERQSILRREEQQRREEDIAAEKKRAAEDAEDERIRNLRHKLEREKAELEQAVKEERRKARQRERDTPEYKERQRLRRLERSRERERERESIRETEKAFIQKKLGLGANNDANTGKLSFADLPARDDHDAFGTWTDWRVPGGVPRLVETPPTPPPGSVRSVPIVHCEGDYFGRHASREANLTAEERRREMREREVRSEAAVTQVGHEVQEEGETPQIIVAEPPDEGEIRAPQPRKEFEFRGEQREERRQERQERREERREEREEEVVQVMRFEQHGAELPKNFVWEVKSPASRLDLGDMSKHATTTPTTMGMTTSASFESEKHHQQQQQEEYYGPQIPDGFEFHKTQTATGSNSSYYSGLVTPAVVEQKKRGSNESYFSGEIEAELAAKGVAFGPAVPEGFRFEEKKEKEKEKEMKPEIGRVDWMDQKFVDAEEGRSEYQQQQEQRVVHYGPRLPSGFKFEKKVYKEPVKECNVALPKGFRFERKEYVPPAHTVQLPENFRFQRKEYVPPTHTVALPQYFRFERKEYVPPAHTVALPPYFRFERKEYVPPAHSVALPPNFRFERKEYIPPAPSVALPPNFRFSPKEYVPPTYTVALPPNFRFTPKPYTEPTPVAFGPALPKKFKFKTKKYVEPSILQKANATYTSGVSLKPEVEAASRPRRLSASYHSSEQEVTSLWGPLPADPAAISRTPTPAPMERQKSSSSMERQKSSYETPRPVTPQPQPQPAKEFGPALPDNFTFATKPYSEPKAAPEIQQPSPQKGGMFGFKDKWAQIWESGSKGDAVVYFGPELPSEFSFVLKDVRDAKEARDSREMLRSGSQHSDAIVTSAQQMAIDQSLVDAAVREKEKQKETYKSATQVWNETHGEQKAVEDAIRHKLAAEKQHEHGYKSSTQVWNETHHSSGEAFGPALPQGFTFTAAQAWEQHWHPETETTTTTVAYGPNLPERYDFKPISYKSAAQQWDETRRVYESGKDSRVYEEAKHTRNNSGEDVYSAPALDSPSFKKAPPPPYMRSNTLTTASSTSVASSAWATPDEDVETPRALTPMQPQERAITPVSDFASTKPDVFEFLDESRPLGGRVVEDDGHVLTAEEQAKDAAASATLAAAIAAAESVGFDPNVDLRVKTPTAEDRRRKQENRAATSFVEELQDTAPSARRPRVVELDSSDDEGADIAVASDAGSWNPAMLPNASITTSVPKRRSKRAPSEYPLPSSPSTVVSTVSERYTFSPPESTLSMGYTESTFQPSVISRFTEGAPTTIATSVYSEDVESYTSRRERRRKEREIVDDESSVGGGVMRREAAERQAKRERRKMERAMVDDDEAHASVVSSQRDGDVDEDERRYHEKKESKRLAREAEKAAAITEAAKSAIGSAPATGGGGWGIGNLWGKLTTSPRPVPAAITVHRSTGDLSSHRRAFSDVGAKADKPTSDLGQRTKTTTTTAHKNAAEDWELVKAEARRREEAASTTSSVATKKKKRTVSSPIAADAESSISAPGAFPDDDSAQVTPVTPLPADFDERIRKLKSRRTSEDEKEFENVAGRLRGGERAESVIAESVDTAISGGGASLVGLRERERAEQEKETAKEEGSEVGSGVGGSGGKMSKTQRKKAKKAAAAAAAAQKVKRSEHPSEY